MLLRCLCFLSNLHSVTLPWLMSLHVHLSICPFNCTLSSLTHNLHQPELTKLVIYWKVLMLLLFPVIFTFWQFIHSFVHSLICSFALSIHSLIPFFLIRLLNLFLHLVIDSCVPSHVFLYMIKLVFLLSLHASYVYQSSCLLVHLIFLVIDCCIILALCIAPLIR